MKKCPECAELVQDEARKCKHCGSAIAFNALATATEEFTFPRNVTVGACPQEGR